MRIAALRAVRILGRPIAYLFVYSLMIFEIQAAENPCVEAIKSAKPKDNSRSVKRWALVAMTTIGSLSFPTLVHDLNARLQGKEHIHSGIYLDFDRILSLFTSEEQSILLSPNRDIESVKKIAGLVASKVHGEYANDTQVIPLPRDASTYFAGQSNSRGVCRHKACVVGAVLRHLGINAREADATFPNAGHMFVELPDYGLAVEATWDSMEAENFVVTLDDYEKILARNKAHRDYSEKSTADQIMWTIFGGLIR